MSLETKIRELMETKKSKAQQINEASAAAGLNAPDEAQVQQGSSQKATYTEIDPHTGNAIVNADDTLKKGGAEAQVKQGSSQDASYNQVEPHAANTTTPDSSLKKGNAEAQARQGNSRDAEYSAGTGKTSNGTYQQPTAPGQGVKAFEETEDADDEVITEEDLEGSEETVEPRRIDMRLEDLRKDIESVFAADANLSEEFKTQAGAIFEAAVIARVNNEVESITAELAEQNASDFEELKEGLVEKVDSYLNYVVEQWMKDNEVAVEQGLRSEVAEDFMIGLKNLFQEHYFEVPEDKVDVLEDMSAKVDEANAKLGESIQMNIDLKSELDGIKRNRIIEQACRDLTATDAEKMSKLLEGVEFDNEELFTSKVKVVKENYFPGNAHTSPEKMLEESIQGSGDEVKSAAVPAHMRTYVEALSRTAKVKHI
jgi:hypothetical protein